MSQVAHKDVALLHQQYRATKITFRWALPLWSMFCAGRTHTIVLTIVCSVFFLFVCAGIVSPIEGDRQATQLIACCVFCVWLVARILHSLLDRF